MFPPLGSTILGYINPSVRYRTRMMSGRNFNPEINNSTSLFSASLIEKFDTSKIIARMKANIVALRKIPKGKVPWPRLRI